jgi:hypothetical protein
MVSGTKVQFRTKEYEVPSLTFGEVERFKLDGTLDKVPANGATALAQPEAREAAVSVVLAALRWNYPEITREELLEELDLGNAERVIAAVLGISGLLRRTGEGEAKP